MLLPELTRTTAFKWTLGIAAWFALITVLLFSFIYWQTALSEREHIDRALAHESKLIADGPAGEAVSRLEAWLREDLHSVRFAALFDGDGRRLAGNIETVPGGLVPFSVTQVPVTAIDRDRDREGEVIRALSRPTADGRLLVLGHDTDQIEHVQEIIMRALGLGFVPALLLSLGAGTLLALRAQRRVALVRERIGQIMGGHLHERLPVRGVTDEFDRLAANVNAMLAEMERLVGDIRGIGDSIAHDLRTPLTRVRTRLERTRDGVQTREEFQEAIDRAIGWIDQTLGIIDAVLRIGEIEHGRRRAAFAEVDLAGVLREVAELYEPIAEEKSVSLEVRIGTTLPVYGDRELIVEAVGNLVDNAVKFTPEGSGVSLVLDGAASTSTIKVVDSGPGIPRHERQEVFKRFYRSEKSRHFQGSGLGLSLVAAIAELHDFKLRIEDAEPGCVFEITCPAAVSKARR